MLQLDANSVTVTVFANVSDWPAYLAKTPGSETLEAIFRYTRPGRPVGHEDVVARRERRLQRPLAPQRRGLKPRVRD